MKLNIGNNIKKYRREKDMTQEALAELIGVSPQAVSRWENGTTYPDMELIPVLANLFGASTDMLFGMPESQKEIPAAEVLEELTTLTRERPLNVSRMKELICKVRLYYIGCQCFWKFWLSANLNVYRHEEILPEVRKVFNTIVEGDFDLHEKMVAIQHFSKIEDEEHLEDLLKQYATVVDLSKEELLYKRYLYRGDKEKTDLYRQKHLLQHIDCLLGNSPLWLDKDEVGKEERVSIDKAKAANELQLQLLHSLCRCIPDGKHPISGTGQIDFFVERRLWIGFHRAAFCAYMGDAERAFLALEDTVSLLEDAMAIQNTELSVDSPWLADISWRAEEDYSQDISGLLDETVDVRTILIRNEKEDGYFDCYLIYPSLYYGFLTATEDNKWYTRYSYCFDNIRGDVRFLACVERVKALIKPEKEPENKL